MHTRIRRSTQDSGAEPDGISNQSPSCQPGEEIATAFAERSGTEQCTGFADDGGL